MSLIKKIYKVIKNPCVLVISLGSKGYLKWLPDDIYLSLVYRSLMNKKLNLKNPVTFNEKLQWLKLHDRQDVYTRLVDKYEVRNYISSIIGAEYLIPILGVYNNFDEINFDELPKSFVLKCTHDSGGVVICSDKSKFNKEEARKKINSSLNKNYYYPWREWPYKNVVPRIICEEYMKDISGKEIMDYKFMCFNGTVKCILVCSERFSESGVKMDFYDEYWKKMNCKRPNHPNSKKELDKPKNFNKMIEFAEKLSKDIPFVRVDFYEINNKVYFGELTFYPAAGMETFIPNLNDELLGQWLSI